MRIQLPRLPWHGNTTLEIDLPGNWDVQVCPMRGADRPLMSACQMEEAVLNPLGSPQIRDLARGKNSAVILFDDMTRPTRTYEFAPAVLRELESAGIRRDNIFFVCALGAHGALSRRDFRKKLGSEIIENFRVFNHNPYENCVHAGTTSFGTPVKINRAVMEADLRIGIGCVTAHAQAGFSGGGKLLLPGAAHMDSISHHHLEVASLAPESTGLGKLENNVLRRNIDEAVSIAGMDFMINVIVNHRGAATAVFAGDASAAWKQAVGLAAQACETFPRPADQDVVIANAFAKANEMTIALRAGAEALSDRSGTLVVIADCPEGQVVHYLLGRFGLSFGGRQYPVSRIPETIDLIIMAPHQDKTFADWFANPEAAAWTRNWGETLALLRKKFPKGARAAVLPSATMQY
ncbi:MAG: lactate racemase domain-containing protein [Desulfosalsimonas sp.]